MVLTAFAIRIVFMLVGHTYIFPATPNHFAYGYETGSIAGAIARGEGFCSPFGVPNTGPTAWIAPLYPYLLAAIFRVFGLFSESSALVILTINSLFAAFTCGPIVRIGEKLFGRRIGLISGWTWALLPFFFRWAITWVWDTSVSAFLLSYGVMLALDCEDCSWRRAARFGAVAGLSALVNPALITLFPLLGLWKVWKLRDTDTRAYRRFLGSMAIMVIVISPWLLRNRVVFGKWIFLRSNAGFEFSLGNFAGAPGVPWAGGHPTGNPRIFDQYRKMGEIAFVDMKKAEGMRWVRGHPEEFARLTQKRIMDFWDGGELLYESSSDPWRPWMVLATSAPALLGLLLASIRRIPNLGAVTIVLLFYPVPYYLTLTAPRFRHAIEPLLVILIGYLVVTVWEELRALFPARRSRAATA